MTVCNCLRACWSYLPGVNNEPAHVQTSQQRAASPFNTLSPRGWAVHGALFAVTDCKNSPPIPHVISFDNCPEILNVPVLKTWIEMEEKAWQGLVAEYQQKGMLGAERLDTFKEFIEKAIWYFQQQEASSSKKYTREDAIYMAFLLVESIAQCSRVNSKHVLSVFSTYKGTEGDPQQLIRDVVKLANEGSNSLSPRHVAPEHGLLC